MKIKLWVFILSCYRNCFSYPLELHQNDLHNVGFSPVFLNGENARISHDFVQELPVMATSDTRDVRDFAPTYVEPYLQFSHRPVGRPPHIPIPDDVEVFTPPKPPIKPIPLGPNSHDVELLWPVADKQVNVLEPLVMYRKVDSEVFPGIMRNDHPHMMSNEFKTITPEVMMEERQIESENNPFSIIPSVMQNQNLMPSKKNLLQMIPVITENEPLYTSSMTHEKKSEPMLIGTSQELIPFIGNAGMITQRENMKTSMPEIMNEEILPMASITSEKLFDRLKRNYKQILPEQVSKNDKNNDITEQSVSVNEILGDEQMHFEENNVESNSVTQNIISTQLKIEPNDETSIKIHDDKLIKNFTVEDIPTSTFVSFTNMVDVKDEVKNNDSTEIKVPNETDEKAIKLTKDTTIAPIPIIPSTEDGLGNEKKILNTLHLDSEFTNEDKLFNNETSKIQQFLNEDTINKTEPQKNQVNNSTSPIFQDIQPLGNAAMVNNSEDTNRVLTTKVEDPLTTKRPTSQDSCPTNILENPLNTKFNDEVFAFLQKYFYDSRMININGNPTADSYSTKIPEIFIDNSYKIEHSPHVPFLPEVNYPQQELQASPSFPFYSYKPIDYTHYGNINNLITSLDTMNKRFQQVQNRLAGVGLIQIHQFHNALNDRAPYTS